MTATVQIREKNTAGETATNKTSGTVRFKVADNSTVDTNDPLVIPSTGQNYSFQKWLRLFIGATGPATAITNPVFYTDGVNGYGTGVKLWAKSNASYIQPVIPSNANDPPIWTGTTEYDNAFGFTSVSPLTLGTGSYTATSADFGDYLVLVMEAEQGAAQGSVTAETFTFAYDES